MKPGFHPLHAFLAVMSSWLMANSAAYAQVSGPYQNLTSASLNESVAACGSANRVTQTINVSDSFLINDLNVGMTIDHTFRGDIRAILRSPLGSFITLVGEDGSNGNGNYDVLFDAQASDDVNTGSHSGADTTSAPFYDNTVRPTGDLSTFTGEEANGTWELELCDNFNGDSGTVRRFELFFTELTGADLSLGLSVSNASPTAGTNIAYTMQINNAGPETATGVTADLVLPSGLTYVSDTSGGSYDSATGLWTAGTIAPGGSASFNLTAFVKSSGGYTINAEILSSSADDPDSTPNNSSTNEDDDDSQSLAVTVPQLPILSCPAAPNVLDWDTNTWTTGSLNGSYNVSGIPINISFTDAESALIPFPSTSDQTPLRGNQLTGGLSPAENGIVIVANQPDRTGVVKVDMNLGTPGIGVNKAQFTLFDVDFGSGQFEDVIIVTGSLNGNPVSPTLTGGTSMSTSGNTATGTSSSDNDANGNLTILFDSPVDTITYTYGNGSGAPADPGQHAITMHDISVCPPPPTGSDLSLDLSVTETAPDAGTNVTYTVQIDNAGPETASGVTTDIALPTGLSYISDTSGGAYNAITGLWTLPADLVASGSTSFELVAFVESTGNYTVNAEILSSSELDPDSTPNNSSTNEDDDDSITLTVSIPDLPILSCPGAATILDWDSNSWTAGNLNTSYTVDGIPITVDITDTNSGLIVYPGTSSTSPFLGTQQSGGLSPAQDSLILVANQSSRTNTIDVSLTLGIPGTGVNKVQFSLFDVDFGDGQFTDEIIVSGSLNGANVNPTSLTGAAAHTVSGATATGTAASNNTSSGTLTVLFDTPVDTVTFTYGNGTTAPSDPGNQAIGFHDISVCERSPAMLTGEKSMTMYDPTNAGLYSIPGNDVIYTITMTNTGEGPADDDSVVIIDALPTEVEFYNGDIDDGGPETHPVSDTDNGSGLTLDYASDVAFSDALAKPTDFSQCTYTPTAGYDPNVRHICINPSGSMQAGSPNPTYSVSFRTRIK